MALAVPFFLVSENLSTSSPMIRSDVISTNSKESVIGHPFSSVIEPLHVPHIGLASANLSPHPCKYVPCVSSTMNVRDIMLKSLDESIIPPVDLSAPLSKVRLGQVSFLTPLAKKRI